MAEPAYQEAYQAMRSYSDFGLKEQSAADLQDKWRTVHFITTRV
jgi:hypothetical protein